MERLTDRRTAEQVRENIEKLRAAGFEVSVGDLRYVKLAEYEDKEEDGAADVQPAKHGRWIMHSDYSDKIICSHCNSARDVYFCERDSMKYCPNCGARMKEG